MNVRSLADLEKLHEGLNLKLYTCTSGYLTIGYGWNIEDRGIPLHIAEALLEYALEHAVQVAEKVFGKTELWQLDEVRRAVVCDMAYNMRPSSLQKYNLKTFPLIRAGKYTEAAKSLLSNKKYVSQVKTRAYRLARMLETGEWPTE